MDEFCDTDSTSLVRINKDKAFLNFKQVQKLATRKINLPAKFKPEIGPKELNAISVNQVYENMERTLTVCRGARVMVHKNLNTGIGLCNGSRGTI